jgi:hypothetical protein
MPAKKPPKPKTQTISLPLENANQRLMNERKEDEEKPLRKIG